MIRYTHTRKLLLGTALTLPFATMALGQALVDINEDELSGKSQECQTLAQSYKDSNDPTVIPEGDVVTAINEDNAQECATLEQQLAGGAEAEQQESERTSEQVDVTEDATIEGQATVSVPDPNVDVQVPAPSVRITEQPPQVDITQQPADIQAEQAKPTITVEIPEIMVRVEIPAPTFYILSPDPEVKVTSAAPQVEVEQGEPTISVTQADPELSVDLGVDTQGGADSTDQVSSNGSASSDGSQTVEGDTSLSSSEPQVEIIEAEGEPQVNVEGADPNVTYQSVEPDVQVMMAEQPTIEVQQTGEPTVVIETADEREQRLSQQSDEPQPEEEAAAEPQQAPASEPVRTEDPTPSGGTMMTVADLMQMEVVTSDGQGVGSPAAFVEVNGEPNLVLSSGGFLGLGAKQVPVPMSRVTMQGEELVVDQMSSDEIEAAEDFEYDSNLEIPDDQEVEIGGS